MTSTHDDPQRLHELASAVIDGTAEESELRELTALLRDHPDARDEYLKLMDLHAVLSTELVEPAAAPEVTTVSLGKAEPRQTTSSRLWVPIAIVSALAACLLVVITWDRQADPIVASNPQAFALLAQGTNAVWKTDAVDVGDRVGATTLSLKSGIVRLEFDSGVEVTLQGPAEFHLNNVTTTLLTHGKLTANVPPGAEGFTVDTPSAQVVDLGTAFGIDTADDGFSSVTVFDGEVEVLPREATQKRLLTEGESVRVGTDYQLEDITFDPNAFERLWPTASGITGSTETIRFVPPWPRQIRFVKSDEHIFIRPEGHSVALQTELNVDISEPGNCTDIDHLTPKTLRAEQLIRSYILHYSPETQLGRRRANRVKGSITFARPVLGIMVEHEALAASSRRFGRRGAGEINQRRELNLTGDSSGDRIILSEDRKTITLELVSPGRSSDLLRVIVEGSPHMPGPERRSQRGLPQL